MLIRRDLLICRNSAIIFSLLIMLFFVVPNFFTITFFYTTNDKIDLDTFNSFLPPFYEVYFLSIAFIYFLSITFIICVVWFYYIDNKIDKNNILELEPSIEKKMAPLRISEKTLAEFFIVVFAIPIICFFPIFLLRNLFLFLLGLPLTHIPWTLLLLINVYSSFIFFSLVLIAKIKRSFYSGVIIIMVIIIIFFVPAFILEHGQTNIASQNIHSIIVMALLTLIAAFWYAVYLARTTPVSANQPIYARVFDHIAFK